MDTHSSLVYVLYCTVCGTAKIIEVKRSWISTFFFSFFLCMFVESMLKICGVYFGINNLMEGEGRVRGICDFTLTVD